MKAVRNSSVARMISIHSHPPVEFVTLIVMGSEAGVIMRVKRPILRNEKGEALSYMR